MPATVKVDIPQAVADELLRLQTEENWSDGRLAKLLDERWGIKASRPTVNRLLNKMRAEAPKPPPEPEPVIEESPPSVDEDKLLDVEQDLWRAAKMAYRARDFNAQCKAATALVNTILSKRRVQGLDQPQAAPPVAPARNLTQAERDAIVLGKSN